MEKRKIALLETTLSAESKKKILWLGEIPTPYRLPLQYQIERNSKCEILFAYCAEKQADRSWGAQEKELQKIWGALHHKVLEGWQFQRKGSNTYSIFLNPEVWSLIRKGRFDLVIIGGWFQPTMFLAALACFSRRNPFVVHSESHGLKKRFFLKR